MPDRPLLTGLVRSLDEMRADDLRRVARLCRANARRGEQEGDVDYPPAWRELAADLDARARSILGEVPSDPGRPALRLV